MPQTTTTSTTGAAAAAATKGKRTKGRAPAHQNTFAFRHNPKSKTTAKILATPIQHCCRRCHEKLEWRKKYRKYKPLSKHPSSCNLCEKRNITAAYHTVCTNCSVRSTKAQALLHVWNTEGPPVATTASALDETKTKREEEEEEREEEGAADGSNVGGDDDEAGHDDVVRVAEDGSVGADEEEHVVNNEASFLNKRQYTRVCAVCFKQPALFDSNDDDVLVTAAGAKPLKLRQVKALQRQKERALTEKRHKKKVKSSENEQDQQGENDDLSKNSYDSSQDQSSGSITKPLESSLLAIDLADEDDPFLQAVGGADKLLTGEAYQRMLLQKSLGKS